VHCLKMRRCGRRIHKIFLPSGGIFILERFDFGNGRPR